MADQESHPVWVAVWRDRTIIWSENAQSGGGRPYRVGRLGQDDFQTLLKRLRACLDSLSEHGMMISGVPCGADEYFRLEDSHATYEYSWFPGSSADECPALGEVLKACAVLHGAVPTSSGILALQRFEFGPRN